MKVPSPALPWRAWSPAERAAAAATTLAGLGLFSWAAVLWREWAANPDLSHGYLALPAIWLLLRRAATDAPTAPPLPSQVHLAAVLTTSLGLLFTTLLTSVYAVAYDWRAAPALFLFGTSVAAATALALLLAAGPAVRWIRPGWTALIIPTVVVLSSPYPPGTYSQLSSSLQEMVVVGVVETLRLAGIPALRSGNLIHLGGATVGVEDACSGVRSLLSCVLAGLVLSGWLLRSPWRRALLVCLSGPLALAGNFFRSLTLTLLAREGIDISGAWHDGLGYAVLAATTLALGWLAARLEAGEQHAVEKSLVHTPTPQTPAPLAPWRAASLAALTALALAAGWFGLATVRSAPSHPASAAPPPLAEILPGPNEAPGWRVETRTDLGRFAGILQTRHLAERVYSKIDDHGRRVRVTAYAAWWPPGGASVSTVAAHTPEACWPGTGWIPVPEATERAELRLPEGLTATAAEHRSFVSGDYPQHVWFWHLVDGRPLEPFDPRSWRATLGLFLRTGFRAPAEQAFLRVSSNLEWEELATDPLAGKILEGFSRLGVPLTRTGK